MKLKRELNQNIKKRRKKKEKTDKKRGKEKRKASECLETFYSAFIYLKDAVHRNY